MSGRSVMPCTTSVTSTTAKDVKKIRSRYGKLTGSASAAASVTIPRRPHQPTTYEARPESATRSCGVPAPFARGLQRQRLTAAAPDTHAILETITATQTAAATPR